MKGESPKFAQLPAFKRYPWANPGVGLGTGTPSDDSFRIDSDDNIRVDSDDNPRIYGE
jgi:hypothetical protein